jgi:hypothetical protein
MQHPARRRRLSFSIITLPQNRKDRPKAVSLLHAPVTRGLVADHPASAVRITNPMLSHATAWTRARRDDDCRSGNDHDGFAAVRTASAIGPAMKTWAAATCYLDRHAGRSLAWRKRHGLRGTSRQPQNESKSDKPVH